MIDDSMYEEFLIEAQGLFEDAESGLMNIDNGEEVQANYNQIYRAFHSLKGASGMFGLKDLQGHMHKLENLFEEMKEIPTFTSDHVDYFLKGIDSARDILGGDAPNFEHKTMEDFGGEAKAPAPASASNVDAKPVDDSAGEKAVKTKASATIFIVDDEPDIIEIIQGILEGQDDYEIHTFTNPLEVLNALDEKDPDLILSDIKMPEMSGLDLLQKVHEKKPLLPMILISGYLTTEACIQALSDGVSGLVQKPFDENVLLNMAKTVIQKYKAYKLLNKSINCLIYQFSDLDEFLKQNGKETIRTSLREQVKGILEQKKLL